MHSPILVAVASSAIAFALGSCGDEEQVSSERQGALPTVQATLLGDLCFPLEQIARELSLIVQTVDGAAERCGRTAADVLASRHQALMMGRWSASTRTAEAPDLACRHRMSSRLAFR